MIHSTFDPILFLGRMHPLLVHLPIGFLMLLLAIEVAGRFKRFAGVTAVRGLVVGLTVATSLLAIVLGLMLKSGGGYDPRLIFWHQWTGIIFGLTAIGLSVAVWKKWRFYLGAFAAALVMLTVASHFGGSLSHGSGYLTAYAPAWLRTIAGDRAEVPAVAAKTNADVRPTDVRSARLYADVVRPILVTNCVACHGTERASGHLRMDSYAGLVAGHVVVPGSATGGSATGGSATGGSATGGPLVERMLLPRSDSHHMPPIDKPQPTDDQIAIVRWWTQSGASETKTVGELKPTPDILQLVAKATNLPIDAPAVPVAPVEDPDKPAPFASLAPVITSITGSTGIVATPVSADSDWIAANAAVARSFGDEQLEQLLPLANNIQSLDLAGTKVTDAGLAVIAKFRHLSRLRLERTAVTDAGLRSLADLPDLEYLNLYGTKVTDRSLETLKSLPRLRHLYLWGTGVDPAAAAEFAAAKPDQLKIRRWQQEMDDLKKQIDGQQVEVIDGVRPTTEPTTVPTTAPAK